MRSSRLLFSAVFCVTGATLIGACVDPKGDYDSYVKRTESYRAMGTEAGMTDSMAPTNVVKGTYYLSCLPGLAFGDISQLFRFYAESEFTPNMTGGGGKLNLKLTPLIIRDDAGVFIPPSTLKLKDEMKGVLTAMSVDVAANGKFSANFMTANVDSHSNPISFRNITVGTTVVGIFQAQTDGGAADYCGGLAGQVTAPIMQNLGTVDQNPCLFKVATIGDALPAQQVSDFMCPGIP
jgi:hypothetical protein